MALRLPLPASAQDRMMKALHSGYMPLMVAPLILWGAYALAGELGLAAAGGGLSVYILGLAFSKGPDRQTGARDIVTGFDLRPDFLQKTQAILDHCGQKRQSTAAFVLEIDAYDTLVERYGQTGSDQVLETLADRVMVCMRSGDAIARIGDSRLAATLHPVDRLDLESALQIAARLQSTLEDPVSVHGAYVYVTVSIGFCIQNNGKCRSADVLIDSATTALVDARRSGPAAIRAFSPEMKRIEVERRALVDEADAAFDDGQICAWFQPQISTDTGRVSGVEALARWRHPTRGMISPAEFLPALAQAGLMERLSETMLSQALATLRGLDLADIHVPTVGVNFSAEELANPKLIERVRWELDRHELCPNRLAVEILETVVAGQPDDVLMRNIKGLAQLGCLIDLDDFGTGHASITSLRQFPIERLKIDRSFVTKCDVDPEQQQMLTAILTMAERLEMRTLAEGLETVGEHALVAQLGIDDVQGFGIARPMSPDLLADWIVTHETKLSVPPVIGGATR